MSKRSKIVIEPSVQWALARRMMMHWGLLCLAMISVYTSLDVLMAVGSEAPSQAILRSFRGQIPLLVVIVLLMPLFLRDSLQMSLKFAGPIYRLRKSLQEVASGETGKPLRFRDGDFWADLAGDFNLIRQRLADQQRQLSEFQVRQQHAASSQSES